MDYGNKKKLFIALVVVGIVVLVAVIMIPSKISKEVTCDLVGAPPQQDPSKHANISSSDNTTLVQSVGYVIVLDQPGGFMELNLHKVYSNLSTQDSESAQLNLNYDCAQINATITRNLSDMKKYNYGLVGMTLSLKQNDKFVELCQVRNLNYTWQPSTYYSCLGQQSFDCTSNDKDAIGNLYSKSRAEIVFKSLQIELDGDKSKHGKGEFDGLPDRLSCPKASV